MSKKFSPSLLTFWVPAKTAYPVDVQPKLDGVRCVATKGGLWTRTGKRIVVAAHIEYALAGLFADHPDAVLDGELVHPEGCQSTVSALMRREPCADLTFNVFDGATTRGGLEYSFCVRFTEVAEALPISAHVRLVETHVATCEADVRRMHAYWVAEGFEGAVIRDPEICYQSGRTASVQKLKVHQDNEYLCVGVAASGCLKFVMSDGRTFEAQGGANFEDAPIGKMVTVRHNGFTDAGIPRHAVAHCLRAD